MQDRRDHYAADRPLLSLVVDNSSSTDSETPASKQARSKRKCHSPGMRRRTRHLSVCHFVAPSPQATREICRQRSVEKMSIAHTMDAASTQSRPMFPLPAKSGLQCYGMPQQQARQNPELLYREMLRDRMVQARGLRDYSQTDMARALGIPRDRYIKMEQRGGLPTHLVERFSDATGCDILWLLTGRGPKVRKPAA